ncbi:hypothetical protein NPIL_279731 [Nephila pilipes]|uniref:Uncharacterized protein n=1 Tax=Nephila pilipes TaxID=299642 RepID=A0A8X6U6E2_NEPPI|nr:hypothetical protein NPIL_279731 [Nephila pilipes]
MAVAVFSDSRSGTHVIMQLATKALKIFLDGFDAQSSPLSEKAILISDRCGEAVIRITSGNFRENAMRLRPFCAGFRSGKNGKEPLFLLRFQTGLASASRRVFNFSMNGTQVRIIGIVGIISSARIVGGVARVHQSVRSQSHVSPLGIWILPWPPMGVQDLNGVWFEKSFSVRVVCWDIPPIAVIKVPIKDQFTVPSAFESRIGTKTWTDIRLVEQNRKSYAASPCSKIV